MNLPLAAPAFDARALQGRVAVVTGATGGLGLAICERLAAMGAQVLRVDLTYPDSPEDTPDGASMRCDIAQPDQVQAMGRFVRGRWGRCDVLVNNAAVSASVAPLEKFPLEDWDRLMQVNLRGALLCAQALVPLMFEQEAGSIVNVASIAAQVATQVGPYGPAKAGLLGLTHQMAVEWGPRGIRSNSISPGMIRTPLSEAYYQQPGKLQARQSKIPLRRIGRPMDIGDAVGFLASDAAAYINGQDIVVDGGFLKASLSNLYQ
jgi:NAD(P)-dependent dehydrogenase (short-subunit alcohol dehydrogenase family)